MNIGADVLFAFGFGWGVWGLALGHATVLCVSDPSCS